MVELAVPTLRPAGESTTTSTTQEALDAELHEYGLGLGVDIQGEDKDLLWVVQEAFNAPIPASWSEHTDQEGRVYFFHEASAKSTWEHPMDSVYRELLGLIKNVQAGMPLEADRVPVVEEHLRQVHQLACASLEGWSGPYISESAGEYYYNDQRKVSTWESPVVEWADEIATRHAVLCRCLLPGLSAETLGDDGSSPNLGRGLQAATGPDLLQALQLPLELIRHNTGDQQEPSTARSYHTARSINSTRSATHSSRSQLSGEKSCSPRKEHHAKRTSLDGVIEQDLGLNQPGHESDFV